MSILTLIVIIVVALFVMWLLQHFVAPLLPAPWGTVMLAVVAIIIILWLLSAFGLIPGLNQPVSAP